MKPNTREALVWITDILMRHQISFQITGGLAVQVYGSTRELADVDIEIPEDDFAKIRDEVASYITFGPGQHKSELWDLFLMTLNYQGQEIDISGAHHTKIFSKTDNCWVTLNVDLSKVAYVDIDGLNLPVIPRDDLIAYKKILARPVDLLDVAHLENSKLDKNRITIRPYKEEDAKFLVSIFFNTIHKINAKDYTPEQINAWAPTSIIDFESWDKKWQKLPPISATLDHKIVGFAEFEENGHIDCFYCHHEYQGCGIGSALMNAIESKARRIKVNKLFAEVSITARPFFEAKGFVTIKEQSVKIREIALTNFLMEKILT